MDYRKNKFSRRDAIKIAAIGAAVVPLLGTGLLQAADSSKASKSEMQYRDEPNGKQECSNCIQFIPGKTSKDDGECKVVAGSISPQGWCNAYAPKS
ncbi:High potential iron-sulfur protein [Nitrosomonas cryotolerans]|uniref:High-potential iron-sulfur protein n=1 Tax=Nitrosomonas cryotolerans ATCC 49181 TaxID=1131553 RepID=A0A1N6HVN1_9PROT|nr:high-potential iron-sulfur protein [Nitrosomonas cryotolerans]SFQ14661.1 High potential iron-sulfur protein [Nitrosomonas cryotolerans]SIO23685.1 High potential iron-sulfur protein [Nitrosomonas cryotolerans ATCC 49181]